MDVRRLAVIRAVVETGSVSAAASKLGYTPSAISQSVAALQREVGVRLFDRAGRGVRPTQAALVLAEAAQRVDAQLTAATETLQALREGRAGSLRLTAFATAGMGLVPAAIASFLTRLPGVDVKYDMAEADRALAALRSFETDVAVVALAEPPPPEDAHRWHPILDDPYLVVLPCEHPTASSRFVDLSMLSRDAWVTTASARCNCEATVLAACAASGFVPRFSIDADEFATTLGFVAAGLGVAMVPALALTAIPAGVEVRAPKPLQPVRRIYAVTRRTPDLPEREMLTALRRVARRLSASRRRAGQSTPVVGVGKLASAVKAERPAAFAFEVRP